jgi:hypothetical protein
MYKKKYLKYKTKYLELKNQLGGNSDYNIIQDGGSTPLWEKIFGSPNKQKVEDKKPIAHHKHNQYKNSSKMVFYY